MHLLIRSESDPYFNIAAEEYFLKNFPGDIIMLWQNAPSVIIGKHQNAYAEINYPFIRNHGIQVVRRISGGGAVYHDHGNLNYTFIQQSDPENKINFRKFTEPMMLILENMGIKAEVGKRNDLTVNELKFSGNAQHLFRNKVIHHGTLLFSSNLDHLNESLRSPTGKFRHKAILSVRSKVCNLNQFLAGLSGINEFRDQLAVGLIRAFAGIEMYQLTDADRANIYTLMDTKYSTWDWNYGYSPPYTFTIELPEENHINNFTLKVANGKFSEALPLGSDCDNEFASILKARLPGTRHNEADLSAFFHNALADTNPQLDINSFVAAFF